MNIPQLKTLFDTLETTFESLGIDYYLIGALAREVWYRRGDVRFRATRDVDFAILVGRYAEFEMVKDRLRNQGFHGVEANEFVLFAPNGLQVDILPFSHVEENIVASVHGTGLTSMHICGLGDVFKCGTRHVELETGNRFKVATLPAIVLLKIIAFDDRPEVRQKDARDIANIIINFFNLNTDLIYRDHHDLFGDADMSLEILSCTVIGREMKKIAALNPVLQKRIIVILQQHISDFGQSTFLLQMVYECKRDLTEVRLFLNSILLGMG